MNDATFEIVDNMSDAVLCLNIIEDIQDSLENFSLQVISQLGATTFTKVRDASTYLHRLRITTHYKWQLLLLIPYKQIWDAMQEVFITHSDFPGYPLCYSDPVFHYQLGTQIPVPSKKQLLLFLQYFFSFLQKNRP